MLHGWPYDIYSFADVTPALAAAGYRVIVPFLRGYGTTRFLSDDTLRNGQQAALAVDVIALMDALSIERAILAGFDWGGRSADVVAALWPDRCQALVSVSGYLISSQAAGAAPAGWARTTEMGRLPRTPKTPRTEMNSRRTGLERSTSIVTPPRPRPDCSGPLPALRCGP